MNNIYPFPAIVGQDDLKLGLLLNAVNPAIGGILIRGEKGTAKSTTVRGLAALLPEFTVVAGCRFCCDPSRPGDLCDQCRQHLGEVEKEKRQARLVNLPLNATEDRVAGGIDFSSTIKSGQATLQPGLLAEAHRQILYIDEANLLDDHIVDLILDTAASGRNVIEREGLSFSHPARFILIGTMNPEEGELRPQFLDRFGLCIEVGGSEDLDQRVTLLSRREEFDQSPQEFTDRFSAECRRLRDKIDKARKQLGRVRLPSHLRSFIAELCASNQVAGHRADLVIEQAGLALAALEGKAEVTVAQINKVAPMALIHRQRDEAPPPPPPPEPTPQEDPPPPDDSEQEKEEEEQSGQEQQEGQAPEPRQGQESEQDQSQGEDDQPQPEPPEQQDDSDGRPDMGQDDTIFEVGAPFRVKKISTAKDRQVRRGSGRRSRSRVSQKQGRYSRASRFGGVQGDIALDATIRAAAMHQKSRPGSPAIKLAPEDVHYKIREKRIGNLLLFVVDASGSMGAKGRMAASKGAVMSLLLDAYQKRDKVSMVSFRRREAFVNLPITNSVELAGKLLAEMPVGGRTPLNAGLVKGYEQVRNYLVREPSARPIIIILTDGKTNVSLGDEKPVDEMLKLAGNMALEKQTKYIVVDTEEEGLVTFELAKKLAVALEADYFKIKDLQAEELVNIVREKQ